MIKGITVDLTIKDNKTGAYLVIPVLPERIEYTDGSKQADTVNILNLGSVDFPSGVDLDSFGWSSFFPARYDASYCQTSNLKTPVEYRNKLSGWKDNGNSLQLICPAAGINKTMYLRGFNWDLRGFEGDIYYSLEFRELKTIKPKKVPSSGGQISNPKKKTPASRPPAPKKPKPKYYTVKPGDYLIKIAKANGIKNWRTQLYNPNRPPLGSNPNLIYPGQKLKLPS
jgi:nucleoid-associated protein YgaU